MAITWRVHGPTPGIVASAAIAASRSLPGPRLRSPFVNAFTSAREGGASLLGHRQLRVATTHSATGRDGSVHRRGHSRVHRDAATSRPACVWAAAVETCWPKTARSAISAPSTHRGTRRPGDLFTTGASRRIGAQLAVDRHGIGVEVEQPSAPRDRRREVTHVAQHGATA